jgi:hypothetical protein
MKARKQSWPAPGRSMAPMSKGLAGCSCLYGAAWSGLECLADGGLALPGREILATGNAYCKLEVKRYDIHDEESACFVEEKMRRASAEAVQPYGAAQPISLRPLDQAATVAAANSGQALTRASDKQTNASALRTESIDGQSQSISSGPGRDASTCGAGTVFAAVRHACTFC